MNLIDKNYIVLQGMSADVIDAFIKVPVSLMHYNQKDPTSLSIQTQHEFSCADPYLKRGIKHIIVILSDNIPCGRVCLFSGKEIREHFNCEIVMFSYFETVNDPDVISLLFKIINDWCKENGIEKIIGPMSPKITDPRGFLIKGDKFVVGMPNNPLYYPQIIEEHGFVKSMDLYEYHTPISQINTAISKLSERSLLLNGSINFRTIKLDKLSTEIEAISNLYNQAWIANWGFLPIHADEFLYSILPLKDIFHAEFVQIAEMDGNIIAFQMVIPDFNTIKHSQEGIVIPTFRAIFMGVHSDFRFRGIELILIDKCIKDLTEKFGAEYMHMGFILESNKRWRDQIVHMHSSKIDVKANVYRIYEKKIY